MKPYQDLNGYDKPWSPGAGENLYDLSWAFGDPSKSAVVTKDGEEIRIVTDGSKTYDGFITAAAHDLPAGTYYIKFKLKPGATLGTGARLGLRKRGDHGFVSSVTALLNADTEEYTLSGTTSSVCYLSGLGNYGSTGEDQAADFTVCDLIVSAEDVPFEPYSNICPISGWTGETIEIAGKNLLKNAVSGSANGITWSVSSDGSVTVTGTASADTYIDFDSGVPIENEINTSAIAGSLVSGFTVSGSASTFGFQISKSTVDRTALQSFYDNDSAIEDNGVGVFSLKISNGYAIPVGGLVFYPMVRRSDAESGYEPYIGETYSVSWQTEAGTVYGGTIDFASGLLTGTMAQIASYNGETINEPWVSDRDVYIVGTVPSIGAQVVYPLTTPITYQLAPQQIATLLGENNIWTTGIK